MTAMKIAAAVIANRIVAQKTTTDATTRVRHEVTPIAGQIAPDLKLVDRMIDVVICNHRKAVATTLVRNEVIPIAGRIAPDLKLVDQMIDVVICNHRKADATTPVPLVVTPIAARNAQDRKKARGSYAGGGGRSTAAAGWRAGISAERRRRCGSGSPAGP